jgi:hypothetical protein
MEILDQTMTDFNRLLNRRWILFALVIGCLECVRLDAVVWDFSTTDGTMTISGQFETDGVFSDTQGNGTHQFELTAWTSWKLDNQDIVWTGSPPTTPINNRLFEWDQGNKSVILSPGLTLTGAESDLNIVRLAFPGDTEMSRLFAFSNIPPLVVQFLPSSTLITPVPEPKEYAIIFLILLGGSVLVRHHNQPSIRSRENCDIP